MNDEEYIQAIEKALFEKGAECVYLNPMDYMTHMLAFPRERYEPNTHLQHLKAGWVGTYVRSDLTGTWVPPKPVYIRPEIPQGTVLGANFPENVPYVVKRPAADTTDPYNVQVRPHPSDPTKMLFYAEIPVSWIPEKP